MRKIFLLIIIILLYSSPLSYGASTTIDSCTFTCTTDIQLENSNSLCETPAGNDLWTVTFDDCVSDFIAGIATLDRAYPYASSADCMMLYEAPIDPSVNITGNEVYVEVERSTNPSETAGDAAGIWLGSNSSNYYSLCTIDDAGNNNRVYKKVAGTSTSLGTCSTYSGVAAVFRLSVKVNYWLKGYKNSTECFTSGDNSLTSFTKAGIVCGEAQEITDNCRYASGFDNFSVVETPYIRNVMTITKWFDITPEAKAQDVVREGRWYITPVLTINGSRIPQVDLATDPGQPLLMDDNGNFTIPQHCRYSANIRDANWALVYVSCVDYSGVDAENTNVLITDEKLDALSLKLSSMNANRRNKLQAAIEKKLGISLTMDENTTVNDWLKELGKALNPEFEPVFYYAK